ncbi:MAG: gliding motility-associated ABC transporter permease subunit GldF [Chitinophagales bacterium]|nr:gliding motility-associated ABC transporter permease subunit GldF [Chitinophagales bacterium]MDW8418682.1 gliding motility-associated ABC transporter permease subunit GldF [Chitinophagales bacterium]
MWAIYRKEIQQFFGSLIGYLAIVVFLLVLGLFIWVFPDTSILTYGYATMDSFFYIAPYVLIFLIPAITMRSFAEEISTGTIELLYTRPVTEMQIIAGKYLAALTLVTVAIFPTLVYVVTLYLLAKPVGNIDAGGIAGSYFGLLFLGAVFTAIGIFCSSITANQIVAFIAGVFLCFFLYLAFDYIAQFGAFVGKLDYWVEYIGLSAHYNAMGKGVIDTRDVIYFLSMIALFLLLTQTALSSRRW